MGTSRRPGYRAAGLLTLAISFAPAAGAQDCIAPPVAPIPQRGQTIFTEEQDAFLGEAVAEQMRRGLRVFGQPGLTGPLDTITTRLQRHLPSHAFRFTFTLIELSEPNAFVLPGGRIFVSRKLVAFVESEDELAGVIAHEMGHVLARQASVALSKAFKDVLQVTSVGGREDVFEKFNRLLDNQGRRLRSSRKGVDDQVEADRIALMAAQRAGYDAEALARFLDRLTGNRGETGSAIGDFFGLTRPESKRIREMLKTIGSIAAVCRESRAPGAVEDFRRWQATIAALPSGQRQGANAPSALKPVSRLEPALRPELTHVRFSPDGAYLVAQDESGINVARREPFELLYRVPARGAGPFSISPDSQRLVFRASGLRVETWDLAKREQVSLKDVVNRGCVDGQPSPDGRFFVCISLQRSATVTLIDLASGGEVASRQFGIGLAARFSQLISGRMRPPVTYAFSPDSRSLLVSAVGGAGEGAPWAFDLEARKEIPLHNHLKEALAGSFAFTGSNRVAVLYPAKPQESGLFEWPDGKAVERFHIPNAFLAPVTKGPYVLVRPFRSYAVGALDLERKSIVRGSKSAAVDAFETLFASERGTGEIGIYGAGTKLVSALALPPGELGLIRGGAHSPDLKWLTLSGTQRSGIWNVADGAGGVFNPFDGSHITDDHQLYAEYEESVPNGDAGVRITRRLILVDLKAGKSRVLTELPPSDKSRGWLRGRYRVEVAEGGENQPRTISVSEAATGRPVWTSPWEDAGRLHFGGASLILQTEAVAKSAAKLIQGKPELKKLFGSFPQQRGVFLMRVLDPATGRLRGETLVDTGMGSFQIVRAEAVRGTLLVSDSRNRTMAYSLETGAQLGRQFGRLRAVEEAKGRVCLENADGEIRVLDGGTMEELHRLDFPAPVAYAGFSGDGARLLAVTVQQQVYIESIP